MIRNLPSIYILTLGCDPEIFITRPTGKVRKRNAVVGSELIVPIEGIRAEKGSSISSELFHHGTIVRDGVQVELHPITSSCRANLSNQLQTIFKKLDETVQQKSTDLGLPLQIDFSQSVRLSKGDLARLSADSKQLGCLPSKNLYGRKHIQRDGTKYLMRSAGGHIHMGSADIKNGYIDATTLVRVMEVLVGNTCVLVDRHPLAAERRKTYGRAGEYRLPPHGVEYRVLSNFWLQNYKLMSMVFGLTKIAFQIAGAKGWLRHITMNRQQRYYPETQYIYNADEVLLSSVDWKRIETAINTNDFDLAKQNFDEYARPLLDQISTYVGLDHDLLPNFDYFVEKIREAELAGSDNPLKVWFQEDPLEHWINKPEGHGTGWESFLEGTVRAQRMGHAMISGLVTIPQAEPTLLTVDGIVPPEPIKPVYATTGARIINDDFPF